MDVGELDGESPPPSLLDRYPPSDVLEPNGFEAQSPVDRLLS